MKNMIFVRVSIKIIVWIYKSVENLSSFLNESLVIFMRLSQNMYTGRKNSVKIPQNSRKITALLLNLPGTDNIQKITIGKSKFYYNKM